MCIFHQFTYFLDHDMFTALNISLPGDICITWSPTWKQNLNKNLRIVCPKPHMHIHTSVLSQKVKTARHWSSTCVTDKHWKYVRRGWFRSVHAFDCHCYHIRKIVFSNKCKFNQVLYSTAHLLVFVPYRFKTGFDSIDKLLESIKEKAQKAPECVASK